MSVTMSEDTPTKPLGIFQIYREALKLPAKNRKLILLIFLISITAPTLLSTMSNISIHSFTANHTANKTQPQESIFYKLLYDTPAKLNVKDLATVEILVPTVVTFLTTSIVRITVIYALALTYIKKHVTSKELLFKVKGNLGGPIITQLLVALLELGSSVLVIRGSRFVWSVGNGSLLVIAFISLVTVVAEALLFYLSIWWALSSIVSIVEEGCYGFGAFKRGWELMQGRKWTGVAIYLMELLAAMVIHVPYFFILIRFNRSSLWIHLVIQGIETVVGVVTNLLFLAAMTVYYYECKKEHERVAGKTMYISLPTANAAAIYVNIL